MEAFTETHHRRSKGIFKGRSNGTWLCLGGDIFALISIMVPSNLYIMTFAYVSVGTAVVGLMQTQISSADATFPHFYSAFHLVAHIQCAECRIILPIFGGNTFSPFSGIIFPSAVRTVLSGSSKGKTCAN